MPRVTYESGGRWATTGYGGLRFESGETKDVSDDAADYLGSLDEFAVEDTPGSKPADDDREVIETSPRAETLDGVGAAKADALAKAGYSTVADIEAATADALDDIDGITAEFAAGLKDQLDSDAEG